MPWPVRIVRSGGRGPAAARNAGWRSASSPWIAFLDDDVEVGADWAERLAADIALAAATVGGHPGPSWSCRCRTRRRPTDWERNTAGLQDAAWITADMAYRRAALESVHGFDERFPRAYREDADLALRVQRAGWRLTRGSRPTTHPVRPADDRVVRPDAGRRRRRRTAARPARPGLAPCGARPVAAGSPGMSPLSAPPRPRRPPRSAVGRARPPCWHSRLVPADSRLPPPAPAARPASGRRGVAGRVPPDGDDQCRHPVRRGPSPDRAVLRGTACRHRPGRYRSPLCCSTGTAPSFTTCPTTAIPTRCGWSTVRGRCWTSCARPASGSGVISNQSGIARGMLTGGDVAAVNRRIENELGPFDVWQICPHGPKDGCICRKPMGGMVLRAATELGVAPFECAVIGDIEADMLAARAAGATGVLVPTPVTLAAEIDRADLVATSLQTAVAAALAAAERHRARDRRSSRGTGSGMNRVLAVRLDSDGDVLLTGPAVRSLAHTADRLDLLVSPAGRAAAELLPSVEDVLVFDAPWTGIAPAEVNQGAIRALVSRLRRRHYSKAVIFTSFHQSPLPMALLARMARIPFVAATSIDYPGSLLDVRHHRRDGHEVEAALDLACAAGGRLPAGDDGRLQLRQPLPQHNPVPIKPYVVVHPGASVPSRALTAEHAADWSGPCRGPAGPLW